MTAPIIKEFTIGRRSEDGNEIIDCIKELLSKGPAFVYIVSPTVRQSCWVLDELQSREGGYFRTENAIEFNKSRVQIHVPGLNILPNALSGIPFYVVCIEPRFHDRARQNLYRVFERMAAGIVKIHKDAYEPDRRRICALMLKYIGDGDRHIV